MTAQNQSGGHALRITALQAELAETRRQLAETRHRLNERVKELACLHDILRIQRDASGRIRRLHGAFQDIDDLKRAQEAARDLARRLEATLESITDAFVTFDRDGVITYVNAAFERITGEARDALLGHNLWERFTQLEGSNFEAAVTQALAENRAIEYELYYPPLAGWFEGTVYPSREGAAVYFRNVSERRLAEQAIRQSEARYRELFDMNPHPMWVFDIESLRFLAVNDAATAHYGYSREEFLAMTIADIRPAEDIPRLQEHVAKTRHKDMAQAGHWRHLTKDGTVIDVEVHSHLLEFEGRPAKLVLALDVTEQRRAFETLRKNEERFRAVARATADAIWDWDIASGTLWWSDGLEKLFGYTPGEMAPGAESWSSRIHPEDREWVMGRITAAIDGGAEGWSEEFRYLRKDGSVAQVIDRGFIMRDDEGRPYRIVGGMSDVTEKKQIEEQLRHAQRLEAIAHLTGGVAHDFNNLLTVLLGNAEMLAEALADNPRLQRLAELSRSAAQRGAELTGRLLAYARRQPLDPRVICVAQLVQEMQPLLRPTLGEDIEIQTIAAPDLWPAAADPAQLESAILNLCINARDAMPSGGRLTLEVANAHLDAAYAAAHDEVIPGDYVMLAVSDSGMGMPREIAERAVEPFFTTKEVGEGSGLGLSMVYGFAKQSGGHLKIYSEPGDGTSIKLYLPRAVTEEAPQSGGDPAEATVGTGEHILLVEDDEMVRSHVEQMLDKLGYRVTSVADGPQALEALRSNGPVDLLFTDVVLPGGLNGRELAERARRIQPALQVLFTSGYTENAIVHQGRLDRGVDLLSKPYRQRDLAAKLRAVLKRRRTEESDGTADGKAGPED